MCICTVLIYIIVTLRKIGQSFISISESYFTNFYCFWVAIKCYIYVLVSIRSTLGGNIWQYHFGASVPSLGWEAKFSRTVQVVVTVAVGCRTATSLEFPHQVEGIASMWFLKSYNHIEII